MKRFSIFIVICCILLSTFPVNAENGSILRIQSVDDFLQFSENCKLDRYSQNLNVSLETDLDLTGTSFSGIPIFCGNFSGNNHTISGLSLTHSGSTIGLFRYLTDSALVHDLNVTGTITPQGSASEVGAIAGQNAGSITNCSFTGTVNGKDFAGGIAGNNNGLIQNCTVNGSVSGNHFIGGIVGTNIGNIQNCLNQAQINTELQQNKVDLTDITLDSITGTEAPGSITDVGGICGISSGSVIGCKNYGNIGYPRIGYNIGGITGSQSGYVADCENFGTISGRKDIGGITGQLEPAIAVTYTTDTLQILQEQVNDLSSLVDKAANNTFNTIGSIQNQITLIQGRLKNATDALNELIPKDEEQLPDPTILFDAIDILDETVTGIGDSLNIIYDNLSYAENTLVRDIQNISDSVAVMQQTLNTGSENLGGSIADNSDADTEGDLTAKIEGCQNSGSIAADHNGGGIAGTIAFENDLDPEADIEIVGDTTLNFSGAYRAVILNCGNTATISVKKQYAGGIAGDVSIGLIKSCTNHANLLCDSADFVGGIAGRSDGYIRQSSAKAQISAKNSAGGIAGQGKTVSDCVALTTVSASEHSGAILGYGEDISLLTGNLYMQTTPDPGAVDGISYDGAAHGISPDEFLLQTDLPDFFQSYTVTFCYLDGTSLPVTVNANQSFSADLIPPLPEIDGCKGSWVGLENVSYFDCIVNCSYEERFQVISSTQTRKSGLPIMLAEGSFLPGSTLQLTKKSGQLAENAAEGWDYVCTGSTRLRFLPPEGLNPNEIVVMELSSDGSWKPLSHTVSDSYVVFTPKHAEGSFCVIPAPRTPWVLYFGGIAGFLAIAGIVSLIFIRRRKINHA